MRGHSNSSSELSSKLRTARSSAVEGWKVSTSSHVLNAFWCLSTAVFCTSSPSAKDAYGLQVRQ